MKIAFIKINKIERKRVKTVFIVKKDKYFIKIVKKT